MLTWYETAVKNLEEGHSYSHNDLMVCLQQARPDLSRSTYHWAISGLVRDGTLVKNGYDVYAVFEGTSLPEYKPSYSEEALVLMDKLNTKYPYVSFTVFETVLMNTFLNHLIAQNTVFLQIEKESSIYVFRFLQEEGATNVLYKPAKKDFSLYWARDCTVVTDLVSEAPIRSENPHCIMLEKMLVDMCADRIIASTFSKAELPDVFKYAQSHYSLDKTRMLRYARRRNKEDIIRKYLEGEK